VAQMLEEGVKMAVAAAVVEIEPAKAILIY